jgi:hypothetical protein
MSEDRNVYEGHQVHQVHQVGREGHVGRDGHITQGRVVTNVDKGWATGEGRGHQPVSGSSEPDTGPTSSSGVSSANKDTVASPATESR